MRLARCRRATPGRPLGAGGGHAVAGQEEEVVDRIVGGQEALGVAGRLEPLHLPFSSAGWLMW
jgi:hypothetical protein